MSKMPNYTSTTNACKLCKPLGASLAFRGIEGCVPFLHGSQGCATYMRRYIISHFNEPIDIASSSLGEKHAVYGGSANLKLGLKNVTAKYSPEIIGVATTCLTETIGDNVPMILNEYKEEFADENSPLVVHVSTPSYAGTHMEGFLAATRATVEQLSGPAAKHEKINVFSGFISTADIRYLKDVCEDFGIEYSLMPDYSDTLDGPALNEYPLVPKGGTPLDDIRKMGGAKASIELGSTLPGQTAGTVLRDKYGVQLYQAGLPIGIRETDAFMDLLTKISGKPMPEKYIGARGRLIDAMVDGHKYISGKRAVVYGEEDLVVGVAALLAEIGVKPVLCASGGHSGKFEESIATVLEGLDCAMPIVKEDVDFFDIEHLAREEKVDMVVGHSKGYSFARKMEIPMIRVGFPIHDRVGGQRILHLGYHGAQGLFDLITNTVIAKKQSDSPIGYSYM
ncbi:nitrogenase component 1 [Desulfogranum japonicum]|uniref:nitrogenase component 1 n=1 Tax=Desulfogranum japonicum TaxID=231447 RepID=UPI000410B733|nr:nitrogenase component 1 [Desulfogranum japonicum]